MSNIAELLESIPQHVVTQAIQLGLIEQDVSELLILVKQSTPYKHPRYNRRNGDVLIKLKDNQIHSLALIQCETCGDKRTIEVFEECEKCNGEGCKKCLTFGEKKIKRPCPECNSGNKVAQLFR